MIDANTINWTILLADRERRIAIVEAEWRKRHSEASPYFAAYQQGMVDMRNAIIAYIQREAILNAMDAMAKLNGASLMETDAVIAQVTNRLVEFLKNLVGFYPPEFSAGNPFAPYVDGR